MLTIDGANRSVSMFGYDKQETSTTRQAAWLRNTPQTRLAGNYRFYDTSKLH